MNAKNVISAFSRHRIILLLCALGILGSCAPTRRVKPLEKGQWAATASLGGSIFDNFGYPLPVPNTTVGVGYGITEKVSGYASVYPTSMAYGVLQFDLGAVYGILKPDRWKPGLSVAPTLNLAGDVWQSKFKLWPQLDANAYWSYGKKSNLVYAGLSSWYELAGKRAHGQDQPQWILPGFQIGHTLCGKSFDFTTELKLNNMTKSNQDLTVSWWGMGGKGAIGLYFGFIKRFGK